MRGRGRGRAAAPSPLSAWPCAGCGGWVGGWGGGWGPGRLRRLARQTRGETGSARRRRRRAADAGGGRVEEGAVAGAKAVGRRRTRGDGGAAARADGKILKSPIFKVTSYSTFTRAITFQNFAQAAEEHAQREADAAKRAVELNAHREAGLVATQV